jgi:copper transport protein
MNRQKRQNRQPSKVRARVPVIAALLTALFLVWGGIAAPAASAHATVVATDPTDGALLPAAPDHVTITYSEAVELQLGALRVFGPDGTRADDGSATHAAGKPETATIPLHTGLKNGTYLVSWRVVSADSHPVHGGFTFSIGTTSPANSAGANAASGSGGGDKSVGVLYGVARWTAYLGFALLAGTAFLLIGFAPRLVRDHRTRRVLAGGWFALLLGTIAALLLQGPYGGGFGLGRAFDTEVLQATLHTRLGKALAYRLILLGAAGAMVSWIATRLSTATVPIRRVVGATGTVLALALALTWSAADHAGTGDQVWLALPADVLHLLAMAAWLGGLTALCVSVLSSRTSTAGLLDDPARAAVVRRFSTVAFASISVLAGTGVYQAWRQIRTWDGLFDTSYGRLILIKSALFITLVGLGYYARRRLAVAEPDLRALRRSVLAEFGIAVAVLAVTALLVESQPAKDTTAAPVSVTMPFDAGSPAGSGSVNVVIDPARAGIDTLHVYILGPDGRLESVPEVTAALALPTQQVGPLPVKLDNAGPGHYTTAAATFPVAGSWQIIVTVRTTDIDQATVILNAEVR